MTRYDALYVDGMWVSSTTGAELEVFDSTTGGVLGTVPAAGPADVDRATSVAAAALPSWSSTPAKERAEYCRKIADRILERADELAPIMTREVGTPLWLSHRVHVQGPASDFAAAADAGMQLTDGDDRGNYLQLREPVGVVACIAPFNYPLHQVAIKAGHAMAAGCTVVVKPSEIAPFNAFMLAEVVDELGLPPGVFNLVSGNGQDLGNSLVASPAVDMITFTGSAATGKSIVAQAAGNLSRVTLELGGKSPNVLLDDLDDPDFEDAVRAGIWKAFMNQGQTCSALTRMLVHRSRLPEAEEIAADEVASNYQPADPFLDSTRLGPLASRRQVERMESVLMEGAHEGATLVCGDSPIDPDLGAGYFVNATVFSEVTAQMSIAQQEIFGPVLCILPYDDEDEAVAIANDSIYGLVGAIWSGDPARAEAVARRMQTSRIEVNGASMDPTGPFQGYKQSSYGRQVPTGGIEEYLRYKSIHR